MKSLMIVKLIFAVAILCAKCFGSPVEVLQANGHVMPKEKDDNKAKIEPPAQMTDENGLSEEDLKILVEEAMDWAHYIGLVERTDLCKGRSDLCQVAPVSLFPSPYPRKQFEEATNVQEAMNLLYFRVSCDLDFLLKVHEEVAQTDEHIQRLMDVLKKVKEEKEIRQPIVGFFQRADYMLNVVKENGSHTEYEIKQLEVNNGSIANTSTDRLTTDLHRHMLEKAGVQVPAADIPDNLPDKAHVEALYMAWEAFGDPNAIILMTGGLKTNPSIMDQRQLEYQLAEKSGRKIKIARLTLFECYSMLKLDPVDHKLRFNDGQVIGVVNTRVSALGWKPKNPDEEMAVRLMFERSTAVKIPSLAVAVSCSKRVQQVLARPGMLERFFPEKEDATTIAAIRKTFAGLWGLDRDDDETKAVIQDAIDHPEKYVLKINRECGGNNIWDDEIPKKLKSFKTPLERAGHILMEKLKPMTAKNYMLRAMEETKFGETVSELGVYGVFVGNVVSGKPLYNVQMGHMMKTKWSHQNEGGISHGGVADTPLLF